MLVLCVLLLMGCVSDQNSYNANLQNWVGMSQETLSRKLSAFQDLGWIDLEGQRIIHIKNRLALEQSLSD